MSCPWESYIMVFAKYYHTCVNVPECSDPQVAVLTVCTHAPSYVCARSRLFCWSLWLRRSAHGCPLDTLPGPASGCPQNAGDPLSSCWTFLSRLVCDGKEGFWLLENTATEDWYLPAPCSHQTEKPCETAVSIKAEPLPPPMPTLPIETGKCGPSEGYRVFLTCANVHVTDSPLFLYCNILER